MMKTQGMKQREIAAYFGVTVLRYATVKKTMKRKKPKRKSKHDAFRPLIQALVHDDPDMNGKLMILSMILCTFYPDQTQVMLYQLLNRFRMIQKADSC